MCYTLRDPSTKLAQVLTFVTLDGYNLFVLLLKKKKPMKPGGTRLAFYQGATCGHRFCLKSPSFQSLLPYWPF